MFFEKKINTVDEFFEFLKNNSESETIFRGVNNENYDLIPRIGRIFNKKNNTLSLSEEKLILKLFKEKSFPYLNKTPLSEIEWLALGQHHGLPTRLLDWTKNPLIAAYFSCYKESKEDSAIYVFKNSSKINLNMEKISEFDPFNYNQDVLKYIPNHISTRIKAQAAVFTLHSNINSPYKSKDISKYIINNSIRKEIKKHLFIFGINQELIYPGLDGLCMHIEWLRTNKY